MPSVMIEVRRKYEREQEEALMRAGGMCQGEVRHKAA